MPIDHRDYEDPMMGFIGEYYLTKSDIQAVTAEQYVTGTLIHNIADESGRGLIHTFRIRAETHFSNIGYFSYYDLERGEDYYEFNPLSMGSIMLNNADVSAYGKNIKFFRFSQAGLFICAEIFLDVRYNEGFSIYYHRTTTTDENYLNSHLMYFVD